MRFTRSEQSPENPEETVRRRITHWFEMNLDFDAGIIPNWITTLDTAMKENRISQNRDLHFGHEAMYVISKKKTGESIFRFKPFYLEAQRGKSPYKWEVTELVSAEDCDLDTPQAIVDRFE